MGKFSIYHVLPKNLTGDVLRPLNDFKISNPEEYKKLSAKYKGREALMERTIPLLDCLWNDVLFFSPVPPEKLKVIFDDLNINWRLENWLELDMEKMEGAYQNAVLMEFKTNQWKKGDFSLEPYRFSWLTPEKLGSIREVPQWTIDFYKNCLREKQPLFVFQYIPHILYRGNIDLKNLNAVKIPA